MCVAAECGATQQGDAGGRGGGGQGDESRFRAPVGRGPLHQHVRHLPAGDQVFMASVPL